MNKEEINMINQISFETINVIPSGNIAIVSTFKVSCNQDTLEPTKFILDVAIDSQKTNTDVVSIPVFLSADNNYHSADHHDMLCKFRLGNPFVAVKLHNLKVFHNPDKNHYFATADRFETVDNINKYIEEDLI